VARYSRWSRPLLTGRVLKRRDAEARYRGRYSIEELSGELGEVISDQTAGRTPDTDITIAKFVGIGAQDLVAAEVTLARLSIHGLG
jgi:ornithine cyclodeaminase/alanine dehydrogenase-like protein (mu-crystallin family)